MFQQNDTVLAGMTRTQLQALLPQLQTAYLALVSGGLRETVSYAQGQGTRSVTYAKANIAELNALIDLVLRCLGVGRPRRALRPIFR